MEDKGQSNITLVVRNEEELYTPYSPVPELNYRVMGYIRSKIGESIENKNISLTVISQKPLDEERFRTASRNWLNIEKGLLAVEEKNTFRELIGLLLVGSILIMASLMLEKVNEVLRYTLFPIMGSLSLSSAARVLIIEMPTIRVKKWIISEIEKNDTIKFKYVDDINDIDVNIDDNDIKDVDTNKEGEKEHEDQQN